nr:FG-GAP-like repeat-containing protein [Calditrichia bacterium]
PNGIFSFVYENINGTTFVERDFGLPGIFLGEIDWVDFDGDDDLDIFLSGEEWPNNLMSRLYLNNDGVFTESGISLPGLVDAAFAWGDIDGDRDPDLYLTGSAPGGAGLTKWFVNENGGLREGGILTRIVGGRSLWGDANKDSRADLFVTGYGSNRGRSAIYINNSGSGFANLSVTLAQIEGCLDAGDFDRDGDLDLILFGSTECHLYRNDISGSARAPEVPGNLRATLTDTTVLLGWAPGADSLANYSFNVRIGTIPEGGEVVSPMSLRGGERLLPRMGNAGLDTTFLIRNLPPGTYYWSVQSQNAGHAASAFAPEDSFVVSEDPGNLPPRIRHHIPDQALVLERDIFLRNLLNNPVVFEDPDNNPLSFSAVSDAPGVASVQFNGSEIQVTPHDTGTVTITVTATDNLAGSVQDTFLVHVIPLPNHTTFTQHQSLLAVTHGAIAWGDYDKDEDLDLVLTGYNTQFQGEARIYRNDDGNFVDINAGLPALTLSDAAWGDYDNDGDLDLIIAGRVSSVVQTVLYRNDAGTFVSIPTTIIGVMDGSLAWGDYDNDGDLDLFVSGRDQNQVPQARLYRNFHGLFAEAPAAFPGFSMGAAIWGDYDTDGDPDLLICGNDASFAPLTHLYNNNDGNFELVDAGLVPVSYSDAAFGDYDNDGDLDILLSGQGATDPISKIYQNNDGEFVDILAGIAYTRGGSVEWGDYENDGDLDLIVTGYNEVDSTLTGVLYENYLGDFIDTEIPIPGADGSVCQWGDFDKDND